MDHDLTKGPYYAIKIAPGIHYTMGGVKINSNTEVLTKEGTPIKGLYAAGELVGGLHGQNRIGGNSVAEIIIFGRQAGEQSAAFVNTIKQPNTFFFSYFLKNAPFQDVEFSLLPFLVGLHSS